MIKFLLELRFWNALRLGAEVSPFLQILWAEMFEDFDHKCLEIGVFNEIARAIPYIVDAIEMRTDT
jgi:hypothetical protein